MAERWGLRMALIITRLVNGLGNRIVKGAGVHGIGRPLHILDDVKSCMKNELV